MPLLLTDRLFRESLLAEVDDPHVVEFFHNRYDQWGREFTIESVLNKATAFTLNPLCWLPVLIRDKKLIDLDSLTGFDSPPGLRESAACRSGISQPTAYLAGS